MTGTVIDVQVFTREGVERDKRAQSIIDEQLRRYRTDLNDQLRIVENDLFERIERMIVGKVVNGGPKRLAKGAEITKEYLADLTPRQDWFDIRLADEDAARQLESMKDLVAQMKSDFDLRFEDKKKRKLTQGDELPPGVIKMVKVYVLLSVACSRATRWPAVTVTRVWFPRFCRWKICRTWRMAPRWTSC